MDLNTLYHRTVEAWADRVNAVGPDQWDRPTPCRDWTVSDLTNHVVGEDLWTAPLVNGSTIADVGDRFDGDLVGDDPVRAALDAAMEATTVVAQRLPEGGTVQLSYGEEQLTEYVYQLATDHLVHAWDLARAVGVDATLDAECVATVRAWFGDREDTYRSGGAIGPRVPLPDGASAQDDLLARFGRTP